MQKNRMGITQFVSEIKRVENYPDFEKLAQAIQHGAQGHIVKNISYCAIVRVRVILKRTVVGDWCFDNLSGSHFQSQVNICVSFQLALQCTETATQQSTVKLPLPTEDIIDLQSLSGLTEPIRPQ